MVTKKILEKNFKSSLDTLMHSDFMRKSTNRFNEIWKVLHIVCRKIGNSGKLVR